MNIILLSGGSGKRLWPLSNDVRSKQFIKILSVPHASSVDSSAGFFADSSSVSSDSSSVNTGTHCAYNSSDKSNKSTTHSADSSADSSANSNTVGTKASSEAGAVPLESMVQRVYRQIRQADPNATITIATSKSQVSALHNQLGQDINNDINNINLSVEPCRRDTFAAIALAVSYLHFVKNVDRDEAVVVCPVDPYVEDEYFRVVKEMYERAKKGTESICLMGIKPTYPSEKYGYIKPISGSADSSDNSDVAASIAADIMVTPSMSDTRDITDIPDGCAAPCVYKHSDNSEPYPLSSTFSKNTLP